MGAELDAERRSNTTERSAARRAQEQVETESMIASEATAEATNALAQKELMHIELEEVTRQLRVCQMPLSVQRQLQGNGLIAADDRQADEQQQFPLASGGH